MSTRSGAARSTSALVAAGLLALLVIAGGAYAVGGTGSVVAGDANPDSRVVRSLSKSLESVSSESSASSASVAGAAASASAAAESASAAASSSAASSASAASSSSAAANSSATASSATASTSSAAPSQASAVASSAADFGGLAGLEAAAKAEGALNVIALPRDWANYGAVIDAFAEKYPEIAVTELSPNASSAEEITAADSSRGTEEAPDVFDVGTTVALASLDYFAPYKVQAWDSIPDANKEATGLWVHDYSGVMAIGYRAGLVGEITSLADLLSPRFVSSVAITGDPRESSSGLHAVVLAALGNGGSGDNLKPGVDFFAALNAAGNYVGDQVDSTALQDEDVAVVFDWTYNQVGYQNAFADWKVFVPAGAEIGGYYSQAVSVDAPHPAAARLWQEFLYSPQAQNLWLAGQANPILQNAMIADGSIDPAALGNAFSKVAPPVLSESQRGACLAYVEQHWAEVTG